MKATFEHIGKKAWLVDNSWSQDIVTGKHPHLAGTASKNDVPVPLVIVSLPYKKVVDGKHEYEFINVLSGESVSICFISMRKRPLKDMTTMSEIVII